MANESLLLKYGSAACPRRFSRHAATVSKFDVLACGDRRDNGKDILLVEDDLPDVELTLATLEKNSFAHKITVVNDGEEALDYLYRRGKFKTRAVENPSLVLLDNKMPESHRVGSAEDHEGR